MSWYRRAKEGITTPTNDKIEAPDGLWTKCPNCKTPTHIKDLRRNAHVCPTCGYHYAIGSEEYFNLLFDGGEFVELDANLSPTDPLHFKDTKTYVSRLAKTQQETHLRDSLRSAHGLVDGLRWTIACMDFTFIGGSLGSVAGEKIARSIDYALKARTPLLIISRSGGARMMEGALSLMQMAKTSARLARLAQANLPFISLLTDPTTGGVSASYAMLGDLNLAEPQALIGFAGPRVIRETIGKDLPAGFQSSEFLLEHGFVDAIVERTQLKQRLTQLIGLLFSAEAIQSNG